MAEIMAENDSRLVTVRPAKGGTFAIRYGAMPEIMRLVIKGEGTTTNFYAVEKALAEGIVVLMDDPSAMRPRPGPAPLAAAHVPQAPAAPGAHPLPVAPPKEPDPLDCPTCGKSCKSERGLLLHRQGMHGFNPDEGGAQ